MLKSAGLRKAMPLMASTAEPGLLSVTVCAATVVCRTAEPKLKLEGLSTAPGSGTGVPVPVRVTICCVPATPRPLSVTVSVPDKAAALCGVN